MRVVMSFCIRGEGKTRGEKLAPKGYQRVVTGPAWGVVRTGVVFDLMGLCVSTHEGVLPLERVTEGLKRARRSMYSDSARLAAQHGHDRDALVRSLESLATWCTIARMRGATDVAWKEA
jgi:hypothetical protein